MKQRKHHCLNPSAHMSDLRRNGPNEREKKRKKCTYILAYGGVSWQYSRPKIIPTIPPIVV
jgi:hypothetical protein